MSRLAIVVDPLLFLSPPGLPIIEALSTVADVWLPRELWTILKNIHSFAQDPSQMISIKTLSYCSNSEKSRLPYLHQKDYIQHQVLPALQQWQEVQLCRDLASTKLYWIGDNLSESRLPNGFSTAILNQFEILAQDFEAYIQNNACLSKDSQINPNSILTAAFRDVTAIATSLQTGLILTGHWPQSHPEKMPSPPPLCDFYHQIGLPIQETAAQDLITLEEQRYLIQLLVEAGVAKWLWRSLRLFAVHLIPPTITPSFLVRRYEAIGSPAMLTSDPIRSSQTLQWNQFSILWHPF